MLDGKEFQIPSTIDDETIITELEEKFLEYQNKLNLKNIKIIMKNYVIDNLPDYFKQYKKSIKDPKNSGTR
jgi:hypothetical protein